MSPTNAKEKAMKTKVTKGNTRKAESPSDKAMLWVAIADTLTREGYEASTVDMVGIAVHTHEELLDLVKELYDCCGSRLNNSACIRVEEAIANAEPRRVSQ